MYTLYNNILSIEIAPKGAELQKIYSHQTRLNYLWDGNPQYWGKHAPILFPLVGALRDDTYYFAGKPYHLPRHGFARDMNFHITSTKDNEVAFMLNDDENTQRVYPFAFSLTITYQLVDNKLGVTYLVKNPADNILYFSIGGHPAFKVPLSAKDNFEDYYLLFNHKETAGRWKIQHNLLEDHPTTFFSGENTLPLTHSLFDEDALVFKNLHSKTISLLNNKNDHGLHFNFGEFAYLGIWSAKNADFVCIEPWCGLADSIAHSQELITKEGIIQLSAGEKFEKSWWVEFF